MHSNRQLIMRQVAVGLVFLFLLMRGLEKPMQATEKDLETRNKQTVQAEFDAWRNGTGSPFDLLAADAKWTIVGNAPVSRTYNSKQEFMDVVIKPFNARMSSRLIPAVRRIYGDGDTVIALFDAEGTARDGKPYRNTYTWYMRMDGGAIAEVIAFFDTIEFTDFWNRIKP
jgi:ketosteroid isomerase-like protein